jgi:tetratricopeptide (TPR) repeat protein
MKNRLLFPVVSGLLAFSTAVCAQVVSTSAASAGNGYGFSEISPFLVNFAKKHKFHDSLLDDAKARRLPAAEFAPFYRKQARDRMNRFFLPYTAVLEAMQRDRPGAYARYSSAAAAKPGAPEDALFKAVSAFGAGRYVEALETLKTVVAQEPKLYDGLPYYWRGKVYAQLGYYEDALADFTAALAILPANPAALNGRSQAFFDIGYYGMSASDLNAFFTSEDADTPDGRLVSLDERCETLRHKGYKIDGCADLNAEGEYIAQISTPSLSEATAAAWAEVERAAKQAGINGNKALSLLCESQSSDYLHAPDFPVRRFKTAVYLLDKAVELDPARALAYARRGLLKFRLAQYRAGTYAAALSDMRRSIELDERAANGWTLKMIAAVYGKYNEFGPAQSALDAAVRLDPQTPYYHHERARLRLLAGDYRDGRDEMRRFFALNPDSAYVSRVQTGPECRTLVLNGFSIDDCRDAGYFGKGPVSPPESRLPPYSR